MDNSAIEQLISEIYQRDALWNQHSSAYRDRCIHDKLWREIAEILSMPIDFLKFKWRNLRNSFRRELKKVRSDAGPSSMNHPRSCPFFSNMRLEQMMPAITDSNLQRSPASPSPHAQITLYPQSAYSSPSTSSQGSEAIWTRVLCSRWVTLHAKSSLPAHQRQRGREKKCSPLSQGKYKS